MVAVVVPSPAWSEVLEATSRTICAPMFSNLFSSSISLATVTPSLVTRGAPNDLSSTTLRPLGPRVTRTASARMSIPCSILSRASTENFTSLAAIVLLLNYRGVRPPDQVLGDPDDLFGYMKRSRSCEPSREDHPIISFSFIIRVFVLLILSWCSKVLAEYQSATSLGIGLNFVS